MDIDTLGDFFNNSSLVIHFFVKSFSIVFSLLYFFYSFVVMKQTQVLNATLEVKKNTIISFISLIQVIFTVALVLYAIFIV
ncbi:hypothetical protein COT62_03295 [Candidatus Roizmanbacteria bacterium CG09_land_8_20_14_0_10_41_9]|uniref:Uncharacterized protein n=1 Tax=Candidatus Roizmanbacteria bacterium CG09_land_8_20_14_0_10_41_9 TaxID=1974850 RepID=A0A2H0WS50_9BACT|nr:MAG: hypothetical protein COT62_03295 [Candidatus Roizmanbacteria bacterium CG09_land_8_20_14_0_10_41_9]